MSTNPFRGLKAFTVDDAAHFWGRDNETASLLGQVCASKLLLLYGKSGVGKTSLLQAGLGPKLRSNDYFPVTARIHANLVGSVQEQVIEALEAQRITIPRRARSLAGLFEDVTQALRHSDGGGAEDKPVVLILDQFEDFFGSFSDNGVAVERREFVKQLADLVYHRGLPLSILISLREDFLPELAVFRSTIPGIFGNYYRLGPLPRHEAGKAIVSPLAETAIEFSEELIEAVLDDLKEGEDGGVEPYALQMVCSHIWDRWRDRAPLVPLGFYQEELGGLQKVLGGFIEERIAEFPPQSRRMIKKIFSELFTARGRGRLVHVSSLYESVREDVASEEALRRDILTPLDRDYRLITIRSLRNVLYCEPIHDTLSQKAGEWRQEMERERVEQHLRDELAVKRKKRVFFGLLSGVALLLASAAAVGTILYRANSAKVERGVRLAQADSIREVGYARLVNKDYPSALQLFQSTLPTYRTLRDERREARSLVDIGRVHVFTGDGPRARASFDSAQALAKRIRDRVVEGEVLERLGALSEREGNVDAALPLYTQSQQSYKAGGDLQASARIGERLAQQAERSRAYPRAEQAYREALESYTTAGDHLGAARVQTALDRIAALHAPWGYVSDLQTMKVYPLLGTNMSVGRDAPGSHIENDIGFVDNLISRRHLTFHRDYRVEDLRSRNGTSINGTMLPFSTSAPLRNGDILVLSGVKALQFSTVRPGPPIIPTGAWAIFVDSTARRYRYLTASEYSIRIEGGRITMREGASPEAQIQVRWEDGKAELRDALDDWNVALTTHESDYEYNTYPLKSNEWIDFRALGPLQYVRITDRTITDEGPSFQFVLLVSPEN